MIAPPGTSSARHALDRGHHHGVAHELLDPVDDGVTEVPDVLEKTVGHAAAGPWRTSVTRKGIAVSAMATARSPMARTSLVRMLFQVSPSTCSTMDRTPRKSHCAGSVDAGGAERAGEPGDEPLPEVLEDVPAELAEALLERIHEVTNEGARVLDDRGEGCARTLENVRDTLGPRSQERHRGVEDDLQHAAPRR